MNSLPNKVKLNDYWTNSTIPLPISKAEGYSDYQSIPFHSALSKNLPENLPPVVLLLDGLYSLCYYLSNNSHKIETTTFIVDQALEQFIPKPIREHMLFFRIGPSKQMPLNEINDQCEELVIEINKNDQDLSLFENELKLPKLKKVDLIIPNQSTSSSNPQLIAKLLEHFKLQKVNFLSAESLTDWRKSFDVSLFVDLNDKKSLSYSKHSHYFFSQKCLTFPSPHLPNPPLQRLDLSPHHEILIYEVSSTKEGLIWLDPNELEAQILKKACIFEKIILFNQNQDFHTTKFFENNLDHGILIKTINNLIRDMQQEYEGEQWVKR